MVMAVEESMGFASLSECFPTPTSWNLNGPRDGQFLAFRSRPRFFDSRRGVAFPPPGNPAKAALSLGKSVPPFPLPAALARLRDRARQARKAAWKMNPSPARSALERLAARWEVIAEAERQDAARTTAANDA
jgi:hypothetical protein